MQPRVQVEVVGLPDDEVEAAFIYNFLLFTTWPDEGRAGSVDSPLGICTVGQDGVSTALGALRGRMVRDRSLQLRAISGGDGFDDCHAVYLAKSEKLRWENLLDATGGSHLLTVVDCGESLCASSSVLAVAVEKNRVVFTVSMPSAERAGLNISAKLLRLAQTVHKP